MHVNAPVGEVDRSKVDITTSRCCQRDRAEVVRCHAAPHRRDRVGRLDEAITIDSVEDGGFWHQTFVFF